MQADYAGLSIEAKLKIDTLITGVSVNFALTDNNALEEPFEYASAAISNLGVYTPATWAEWTSKPAGYTIVSDFINIPTLTESNMYLPVTLSNSTKYGILYTVNLNTKSTAYLYATAAGLPFPTNIAIGAVATPTNYKNVQTTISNITIPRLKTYSGSGAGVLEFGNVRIFRLPAGSVIESDFNTLTADELVAKYGQSYSDTDLEFISNASDAAGFLYDDTYSTKEWYAVAVDSGVDDTGNSTTLSAPVADTHQVLRIEVSSTGNTIYYYVDGVLVKTLTGGGISPDVPLYATIAVNSTAAASKTVDVDYIHINHNR